MINRPKISNNFQHDVSLMKQCQLLTQLLTSENAGYMPALTGFPHSWKKFLEWKSPWADSIHQKDPLWMLYEHAHLWSLSQKQDWPEEGTFMGDVALQCLSRGLHRMVGQSWAGVCCLQGTKDFFSQTIFQGRHTFSWRISFSALETTCQKASQQLCGIIHAGTLLSSRLGPAHCPTDLWAGGIPVVCLLSASQQGQQLWGSLCLLQAVGQLGTGTDVHWRTGRPGSAVPLPWVTREMQGIISLDLSRVLPCKILAVGCPCSSSKELLPPGRMIHTDPFFPFNFHPLLYLQRLHSTRNSFVVLGSSLIQRLEAKSALLVQNKTNSKLLLRHRGIDGRGYL